MIECEKLRDMYVVNKWGMSRIERELEKENVYTSVGAINNALVKCGICVRSASAAALIRTGSGLDYQQSYLSEDTIEWLDGFLLGDGSLNSNGEVGRASCSVKQKEFCQYLLSGLPYEPHEPVFHKYKEVKQNGSEGCWNAATRFHPDLALQYARWYPNGVKIIPNDVRITKTSLLLFYLGDGSLVNKDEAVTVRLSSECFTKENIEATITPKMTKLGIECYVDGDGRIRIRTNGIKRWFEVIGQSSPLACFDHKFSMPSWRFTSYRASQVAGMLCVNLSRLQHLIKAGRVPCYRASEKGRPRLDETSIAVCRELIQNGELY